jgi:hypothetical protein
MIRAVPGFETVTLNIYPASPFGALSNTRVMVWVSPWFTVSDVGSKEIFSAVDTGITTARRVMMRINEIKNLLAIFSPGFCFRRNCSQYMPGWVLIVAVVLCRMGFPAGIVLR